MLLWLKHWSKTPGGIRWSFPPVVVAVALEQHSWRYQEELPTPCCGWSTGARLMEDPTAGAIKILWLEVFEQE